LGTGHVVGRAAPDDGDTDLRIAFDFDGVLADDSAERVFQSGGLEKYQENESALAQVPLDRGPMADFLEKINRIQGIEDSKSVDDPQGYRRRVRVAVVTRSGSPTSSPTISAAMWKARPFQPRVSTFPSEKSTGSRSWGMCRSLVVDPAVLQSRPGGRRCGRGLGD